MKIEIVSGKDVVETGEPFLPNTLTILDNVEPFIAKMIHEYAKIGRADAIKTKNKCVILYHTPTYYPGKELYWDAIYQNVTAEYAEKYEDCEIYVAWYLKRSEDEHIHTAIIVPLVEFLSWCGNIPTDRVRDQNKWSFSIREDRLNNSYEIKFSKKGPIDLSDYVNPFELFLDKAELEQLLPKSGKEATSAEKSVVAENKSGDILSLSARTIELDAKIAPVMSSFIENKKKKKELEANMDLIKDANKSIQDKRDVLKNEYESNDLKLKNEIESNDLKYEDCERRHGICDKEVETNKKSITDIIGEYQKRIIADIEEQVK